VKGERKYSSIIRWCVHAHSVPFFSELGVAVAEAYTGTNDEWCGAYGATHEIAPTTFGSAALLREMAEYAVRQSDTGRWKPIPVCQLLL
jgi:hypothetical protein